MTQKIIRAHGRAVDQLRPLHFTRHYTCHAEGSVLVKLGETWVLCTASVEEKVPGFLRGTSRGWVTAEYGMLPRATTQRNQRDGTGGIRNNRAVEIQRLIGRSLRAIVNFEALTGYTIVVDCDVIQADGGTRTAAINGAYLALHDAVTKMLKEEIIHENPLHGTVAAISVGICAGQTVLDLDYQEDSSAEVDMNVVMNDAGQFIELQGTAEGHAFRRDELNVLLDWAERGIQTIIAKQHELIAD